VGRVFSVFFGMSGNIFGPPVRTFHHFLLIISLFIIIFLFFYFKTKPPVGTIQK
jgi:hypothetical protein